MPPAFFFSIRFNASLFPSPGGDGPIYVGAGWHKWPIKLGSHMSCQFISYTSAKIFWSYRKPFVLCHTLKWKGHKRSLLSDGSGRYVPKIIRVLGECNWKKFFLHIPSNFVHIFHISQSGMQPTAVMASFKFKNVPFWHRPGLSLLQLFSLWFMNFLFWFVRACGHLESRPNLEKTMMHESWWSHNCNYECPGLRYTFYFFSFLIFFYRSP